MINFRKKRMGDGGNIRNTPNVSPLPTQFISYGNRSKVLKSRFKCLYRYPVSGIIDLIIDSLMSEKDDNARKIGNAIFRKIRKSQYIQNQYRNKNLLYKLARYGCLIL